MTGKAAEMKQEFMRDALRVRIYETRAQMGAAAAADIASAVEGVLSQKAHCSMIFAAAPSQSEVLAALAASELDWGRIHVYHMDEYIGMPADAPQGFANFLRRALFEKVPLGRVCCLNSQEEPEKEAARYSGLLREDPADIVVMGVGENGHIAFNDPHVADFNDLALVKPVKLDPVCRMQQVHDGCFARLEEVPEMAVTLTVPALCRAGEAFCIVPAKTKAWAVKEMLEGRVDEHCPASILRRHSKAALYLDRDSASLL